VFEDVLDPADLEMAYAIESRTNDRLRDEAGELFRVPPTDRISGSGSTPLMAAFTHIGTPSRFTAGLYGIYYAASNRETAIAETRYHRELFLAATREESIELTMRLYVNQIERELHDIRDQAHLHLPEHFCYPQTQAFAATVRESGSWGLLYNSLRNAGGGRMCSRLQATCPIDPLTGSALQILLGRQRKTDNQRHRS
jgi:hypothetical protein